ncbi:Inositol-pentakisphosphate 2-kinase [Apostasia shenzhenica]|uniref:Inositol-pentakisphosphate 2-kinase n=1 Tax=Apostasia shenzhenica TaxID=1088818 RepID=A0A2I0B7Y1_9ASPA|nr:Inositol-pentakisphosphate 2-kinase [Apostasia shenzhenica]
MEFILKAEDAKDWEYKGEGAANVVLSYRGSFFFLIGKVLRIQKVPRGQSKLRNEGMFLSSHERLIWRDVEGLAESTSKDIAGQVFMKRVISPLLGSKNIDGGIHITVSTEFLESIEKNICHQRPSWRVDATKVDTLCNSALLIADYSVFIRSIGTLKEEICFAVEIKPKCGFLPSSEFIAQGNVIKKHVTRFRMHQLFKLHNGEVFKLSEYNPLDLFSGKRERIYPAIAALLATPQNNFRVFLNGSLIVGGLGCGMDSAAICLNDTNRGIEDLTKITGLRLPRFVELVSEAIFSSAVLDQLLLAQKLDRFDIEGAIHAYYNVLSQPCEVCKTLTDNDHFQRCSLLHAFSLEESLMIVRDYLIAATAKDCSLMISFRPVEDGFATEFNSLFLKSCGQSFEYKVNFIDLDMKPLKKMVYYYGLDQKIVNLYNNCKQNEVCNGNTAE